MNFLNNEADDNIMYIRITKLHALCLPSFHHLEFSVEQQIADHTGEEMNTR